MAIVPSCSIQNATLIRHSMSQHFDLHSQMRRHIFRMTAVSFGRFVAGVCDARESLPFHFASKGIPNIFREFWMTIAAISDKCGISWMKFENANERMNVFVNRIRDNCIVKWSGMRSNNDWYGCHLSCIRKMTIALKTRWQCSDVDNDDVQIYRLRGRKHVIQQEITANSLRENSRIESIVVTVTMGLRWGNVPTAKSFV